MARKELGHIELQWTCPNCRGINPGPDKNCNSCGRPQPEDVEFEQADRQVLITDEEKKKKAAAAPDIHCPYCGTRNPAGTKICLQCGGDLVEGQKRESGRVIGAFQTGPVTQVNCPHCGAKNPDTAMECAQCGGSMHVEKEPLHQPAAAADSKKQRSSPWVLILGILALVILCGAIGWFALLSARTETVTGQVQRVVWERTIPIEAIVPVSYSDWIDQVPSEAQLGACRQDVRYVQDEPAPNSEEVCGTPYTVDEGSGYAEVVQDCQYYVYEDYCDYSVQEWRQVDLASASGSGTLPEWPDPILEAGQRLGSTQNETYVIYFSTGEGNYSYTTSDFSLYQSAQPGTEWDLNINSFGSLVSIER